MIQPPSELGKFASSSGVVDDSCQDGQSKMLVLHPQKKLETLGIIYRVLRDAEEIIPGALRKSSAIADSRGIMARLDSMYERSPVLCMILGWTGGSARYASIVSGL